jgi:hypothetical protein
MNVTSGEIEGVIDQMNQGVRDRSRRNDFNLN